MVGVYIGSPPLYTGPWPVESGRDRRLRRDTWEGRRRHTMATAALVIGWGQIVRGREQKALQVFNEAMQYYTRLQERGEIESFEPVALEPHGGDLNGFILVRGDREKLNRLRYSEEFLRLTNRAGQIADNVGVISAFIGDELNRLFADLQAQTSDLA